MCRSVYFAIFMSVLLALPWSPAGSHAAATPGTVARSGGTAGGPCFTPLTLMLRPGPLAGVFTRPGSAARDIPTRTLSIHLPLYPGSVPSNLLPVPSVVPALPPAYRKGAQVEFAVPAGYADIEAWYRQQMLRCGYAVESEYLLQQHRGPRFAGLTFYLRGGLPTVSLIFRPVSAQLTEVLYVAQTLDVPPRPADSFLHGPFTSVRVSYQSTGVVPGSSHRYRFTITWPATVARLVAAVNRLRRINVPGLGSGGVIVFSERAVLSFVRPDGGARRVSVGGVFYLVVVGHTRPLDDTNGAVDHLVHRIVTQRCSRPGACAVPGALRSVTADSAEVGVERFK